MNTIWSFVDGRLAATGDDGRIVASWTAEHALGFALVDLLNHNESLSNLLLSPWRTLLHVDQTAARRLPGQCDWSLIGA